MMIWTTVSQKKETTKISLTLMEMILSSKRDNLEILLLEKQERETKPKNQD